MTKPEQCVGLTTHKWIDSCPHKILPVKYLSSFDQQNLSFQDLASCKPAAAALPEAAFQYRQKTFFFNRKNTLFFTFIRMLTFYVLVLTL